MTPKDITIWIHTSSPSPYRRHLFEKIGEAFPGATVFFMLDMGHEFYKYRTWKDDSNKWSIKTVTLSKRISLPGKLGFFNPALLYYLLIQPKHTLHLVGSVHTNWIILMIFCMFHKGKYIVWNDAGFPERLKGIEQSAWYRFFKKHVTAGFSPGKLGKKFTSRMGIPENRIFNAFFSHDVEEFKRFYYNDRVTGKRQVREQLNIGEDERVILCISRFLGLKRLEDLASALLMLENKHPEIAKGLNFVLIGDGEHRAHEKKLSSLSIIRFHQIAQVPYPEIKPWYAAADIFIFPSEGDIWGLVVNEALSLGVPVICTDLVGASELVKDGWNGYVIKPRAPEVLFERLCTMLKDPTLLENMKENAISIHSTWNSDLAVKNLKKMVADIYKK